ncbi:MAG: hypothetical protein WDA71_00855 [Actinomycetota bacterium]
MAPTRLSARVRRAHEDERGIAVITAVIVLFVLSLLVATILATGTHLHTSTVRQVHWNQALAVAEAGLNEAVFQLNQDPTWPGTTPANKPCDSDPNKWIAVPGGSYCVAVTHDTPHLGWKTLVASGRSKTAYGMVGRKIREVLAPPPSFKYAIFSNTTLDVGGSTNCVVTGDIYSVDNMTLANSCKVEGSVMVYRGNLTAGNNVTISRDSWTGGDASGGGDQVLAGNVVVGGNATAGEADCTSAGGWSDIGNSGATVKGDARASGSITVKVEGAKNVQNKHDPCASQPPKVSLPVFSPSVMYQSGMNTHTYGSLPPAPYTGGTPDAAARFNVDKSVSDNGLTKADVTGFSGNYAIWQSNTSQSTPVVLPGELTLAGNTMIVTNAPIVFDGNNFDGNNITITSTQPGVIKPLLVIVSLYAPPGQEMSCSDQGGDCSIWGKNKVQISSDVATLFYTTGMMAFKNSANRGNGALYGGNMDVKNGFEVTYDSRVERVVGFGDVSLVRYSWEELKP